VVPLRPPSSSRILEHNFCSACGLKLPKGIQACPSCGHRLPTTKTMGNK
jgi:rRNA maturation endonuclease Nob1